MGNITASRTQLKPDPRYDSILVSKFVNCLMWDGKKQEIVGDPAASMMLGAPGRGEHHL